MVYDAGRQGLQIEIAHAVTAYNHGVAAFTELVNHLLQGVRATVKVIAVQLHCKPSAFRAVDGQVPASSYAQVRALRYDMYQTGVIKSQLAEYVCGAVGGVVVNHNHVECAVQLLAER